MKKTLISVLSAALIVLSGCQSASQFYGVATGASVGGMFGSAIGSITGGWRGSNAGRLAGMVVGGVIGAAATTPKANKESRTSDYYNGYDYDDYHQNNSYSPYSDIYVENIRLAESMSNNCIDAGEHAKLIFEIRNEGNEYVYDIAPVITVSGTKEIYLSPTAIISELGPGRAVRYQAEVVATKKLKNGVADFNISFSNGDQLYTVSSFQIRTRKR
ncbi:MAG: hypothetical protein IK100_07930 [Muribaculaceae bacterium]|nr:hypothetical protein [Muribaculaceae bacterium]